MTCMSSRLLSVTAASSDGSFGFYGCVQWNLCILSINHLKYVHGCHGGAAFHLSQLPTYIVLYCMPYCLVWRQSTTSSTSYSLWALWSLSSSALILIDGPGGRICPGNGLFGARCNFHGWKIDVSLAAFKVSGIANLYALLSIFQTISHSPAFFRSSNFLSLSEAKCLASTYILSPILYSGCGWWVLFVNLICSSYDQANWSCRKDIISFCWATILLAASNSAHYSPSSSPLYVPGDLILVCGWKS